MLKADILAAIRGKLIVSCQALPDEPLFGSEIMAKMALAAVQGGASAIRANTPEDIAAIRMVVDVPIIGLYKVDLPEYDVYITPRLQDAVAVSDAGADIIATDATDRQHPEGTVDEFIAKIKSETGKLVMADISTIEEGCAAARFGADLVSTTMSGYTPHSPQIEGPDLQLVDYLVEDLGDDFPVIAEGRYTTPDDVRKAMRLGAYSVVVGGAITRPKQITERFVRSLSS